MLAHFARYVSQNSELCRDGSLIDVRKRSSARCHLVFTAAVERPLSRNKVRGFPGWSQGDMRESGLGVQMAAAELNSRHFLRLVDSGLNETFFSSTV